MENAENDVILSIVVPTYNHEKYIAKTLDGILMQQTAYPFEVLVGEDASPDGTRSVLQEYEKKYPGRFIMIYRDVNAGGFGNNNGGDLIARARGKYLAYLEGDDFWTDEEKIERQLSFLEEHGDYVAAACNTVVVDENSEPTGETYPQCRDEEYTLKHYRRGIFPGQTACMIYRMDAYRAMGRDEIWLTNPMPGDRIIYFWMACHGKIRCIQRKMSAYRHITSGGTSYSASRKVGYGEMIRWWENLVAMSYRMNNREAEITAEGRYFTRMIMGGLLDGEIGVGGFLKEYRKMRHKIAVPCTRLWDALLGFR